MDTKFLDEAILGLARASGGAIGLRRVGGTEESPIVSGEDRHAWAARLVEDALALEERRSIRLLEIQGAHELAKRTARPALPGRPVWIDIPFEPGDTLSVEGVEELRRFALALEAERRAYLADGCTAVTKAWREANEKRITSLTADLACAQGDLTKLLTERDSLRAEVERLRAPTTDKGAPVKPTADEEPVAGSGSAGAPPSRVLGLRPVFVQLNDLPLRDVIDRELRAGSSPIVIAHAAMRECMRQIVEFNEGRDDVAQPHVAIRLPDPIPEPDEDTCVSSAEEIEDHAYNEALEDVRTKLTEQGFHVAP